MSKKLTIEEMHQIAKARGGSCLSRHYINSKTKLKWRCKRGHEWMAKPENVKGGRWCKLCGYESSKLKQRDSIDKYHKIAKSRGGLCLSKTYTNAHTKLTWKCKEGHVWETVPSAIQAGQWCAVCAGVKQLTINDAHKVAKKNSGKCLSKIYRNNRQKLEWECHKGHRWKAALGNVKGTKKSKGTWCPRCAGNFRISITDLYKVAKERKGKCLAKPPVKNFDKVGWQCQFGHDWKATPADIKSGKWCPDCAGGFAERLCRQYLEKMFHRKFPKVKSRELPWLRASENSHLELDGYCKELSLAFEHHGRQHWQENKRFNSGRNSLKKRIEVDKKKKRLCLKNGVQLLVIEGVGSKIMIDDLPDELERLCAELGIKPKTSAHKVKIDWSKTYSPDSVEYFQTIKNIALAYGGKCLSKEYKGALTRLEWQCKEGHTWWTTPSKIKSGQWCNICRTKEATGKLKDTIEVMREVAKKRGGQCLSKKYVSTKSKLLWQCKMGHKWKSTPGSVKAGTWCPKCGIKKSFSDRFKRKLMKLKKDAEAQSVTVKLSKVTNVRQPCGWKCKVCQHKWTAPLASIIYNDMWCPNCRSERKKKKLLKYEISDLNKIVKKRGGVCLSKKYKGVHHKLEWRCKRGHLWESTPASVINLNTWCPKCALLKRTKNKK